MLFEDTKIIIIFAVILDYGFSDYSDYSEFSDYSDYSEFSDSSEILFLKQFIEQGVERRVFAHDGLHYLAIRTDNNLGGETSNPIIGQEC